MTLLLNFLFFTSSYLSFLCAPSFGVQNCKNVFIINKIKYYCNFGHLRPLFILTIIYNIQIIIFKGFKI